MKDRAAEREEYKNRIKRTKIALDIEREIYLRVFSSNLPNNVRLNSDDVLGPCQKRLKEADYNHTRAIRFNDISRCIRCQKEGIGVEDEKEGDKNYFEIFQFQSDGGSEYAGAYLCEECMGADDHYLANCRNPYRGGPQ